MSLSSKPLLVGEMNPYGGDPRYALYPEPEYSAGGRLCRLILQMTPREYIKKFDRVNLCTGRWSMREARARAREIEESHLEIILLGSKVCSAFDLHYIPFTALGGSPSFTILPHPSGLNRMWNAHNALDRARATLREAGVL